MSDIANGEAAYITVRDGDSMQFLVAEWEAGSWQSGAQRFDPSVVTEVQPVLIVPVPPKGERLPDDSLTTELDLAGQAISAMYCPFWRGTGTCEGGCYSEPSCQTDTPAHGWPAQLLAAAKAIAGVTPLGDIADT